MSTAFKMHFLKFKLFFFLYQLFIYFTSYNKKYRKFSGNLENLSPTYLFFFFGTKKSMLMECKKKKSAKKLIILCLEKTRE